MSTTVSDFLLRRLGEWGITRIYGYPGDGINGILGALNRAGDDFEFIQVRHEELAAFMACGHAKFAGQVGVCLVGELVCSRPEDPRGEDPRGNDGLAVRQPRDDGRAARIAQGDLRLTSTSGSEQ
jgi:hypothetical protein